MTMKMTKAEVIDLQFVFAAARNRVREIFTMDAMIEELAKLKDLEAKIKSEIEEVE